MSFYSLSDQGKALAGTRTELDLTLRPETRDRVKAHGVRVNPRINLPPGRYQLRIGARETVGGLTGSVFYDLEVPDFRKEKVMMGGLLLPSRLSQQTPSIQPDHGCLEAAAGRRDEPARVLAERYPRALHRRSTTTSPRRQPRRFDVAMRLLSEDGNEVFASRDELTNAASTERSHGRFTGIRSKSR